MVIFYFSCYRLLPSLVRLNVVSMLYKVLLKRILILEDKIQDTIFKLLFEYICWKMLLHLPAHLYVCAFYIVILQLVIFIY